MSPFRLEGFSACLEINTRRRSKNKRKISGQANKRVPKTLRVPDFSPKHLKKNGPDR